MKNNTLFSRFLRRWQPLGSRLRFLCAAGLLVALAASLSQAAAPNIVLILTDDQGWNGTSVLMDPNVPGSKSDFYQTPNIAALAAGGMRFSSGYAAVAVVCLYARFADDRKEPGATPND